MKPRREEQQPPGTQLPDKVRENDPRVAREREDNKRKDLGRRPELQRGPTQIETTNQGSE